MQYYLFDSIPWISIKALLKDSIECFGAIDIRAGIKASFEPNSVFSQPP